MQKETTYTSSHKSQTINVNQVSKPVQFINGEIVEVDVPRGTIFGGKTNFPKIKDTDIVRLTEFYKWLESEHAKGANLNRFIDVVRRYTKLDFPFKGRTDGPAHKVTFDVYWQDVLGK